MSEEKRKQGKRNKINGAKFENLVRKDLESKGWIVSKWNNNVEFLDVKEVVRDSKIEDNLIKLDWAKLVPAKRKFNPFNKALSIGTGFPDFIAFFPRNPDIIPQLGIGDSKEFNGQETIIGVEAKSRGYLDKEERKKCEWLIENKIFSKIIIAMKDGKGIKYKEFEK
jgi:hypothetical protein